MRRVHETNVTKENYYVPLRACLQVDEYLGVSECVGVGALAWGVCL